VPSYDAISFMKGSSTFNSILAACKYAEREFKSKRYQLERNLKCKDIIIIPQKQTRKNMAS